jgi:hypothetical protein
MIEPGWYNDELDPSLARWHDGTTWTDHTMDKASWTGPGTPPAPDQLAPSGPAGGPLGGVQEPPRPVPLIEAPPLARRSRWDQWERPSGYLVAAIASLVVIAVCLVSLQRLEEERDAEAAVATTSTTTPLQSFDVEYTAQGGSTYRLSITPKADTLVSGSPNGCLEPPGAGRVLATFTVRVTNTSPDAEAPVPQLAFGVNLTDGALDPNITSLDRASTDIEVGPVAAGTSCSLARTVAAGQGGTPLAPGASQDFEGVVADVPLPFPQGLSLIVRYFQTDPNPRGSGFAPVDLPVLFPAASATPTEG